MVLSLVKCFAVGGGLAIAKCIAAGTVWMLGVPSPSNQILVARAFVLFFLGVSISPLVMSPSPVINVCLFVLFLSCMLTGCAIADCLLERRSGDLLPGPVKWIVFALLVGVMALVVGNGYPANPLATMDLVNLMRDPLTAIPLCTIAATMGFVFGTTQEESYGRGIVDTDGNTYR
jgi:hypothetical protein